MRLKFKIKSNPYQELLEKSQQLVAQMEQHPQEAKFELSPLASPAAKTIAENVNRALYKWKEMSDNIEMRLKLVTKAVHMGLWDMIIVNGDPAHPDNTLYWSDDVRRMMGYEVIVPSSGVKTMGST